MEISNRLKKQKFNDLVWNREYLKALTFYKENKDKIIFDEMPIKSLAEAIHDLGNYQDSYELHKMIFENDPDQIEIDFYERLNESWIKKKGLDYDKYLECFYNEHIEKEPKEAIKNCPECGKKLTKVLYGYIPGGLNGWGDDYALGGCIVHNFNILRFCRNCGAEFTQYDLYGPNIKQISDKKITKKEIDELNIVYIELEEQEIHGGLPVHLLKNFFKKEFGIDDFEKVIDKLELAGYVYRPFEGYVKLKK